MDTSIYSTRYRQIRESLGLNQTDFAQGLGIPRTSSINYEKGTSIPSEILNSLVNNYNVNIEWFLSGKEKMFRSQEVEKPVKEEKHPLIANLEAMIDQRLETIESRMTVMESRFKGTSADIPSIDMYVKEPEPEYGEIDDNITFMDNIAAGRPIYASEDRSTIPVPRRYIKTKPEDYYAGRIKGTSMTAAGIPDGVLVLIRISDVPRDGAIQVVEHQGEVTLKRIREIPGKGWKICFDDYSGRYIEVGPGDEFRVQGDFVAVLPEKGK